MVTQAMRPRQPAVRSKSSNSHEPGSSQRAAPRRPRGASSPSAISAAEPAAVTRPFHVCETRDSSTQTAGKASRTSPAEAGEVPGDGEAVKRSDFLFGPIQLQSELGMAIQAALEFTAEQRATCSPPDIAAMGRMHLGGEEEVHSDGEDLEVRSLSLSEDGPVITRELSERERQTAAPDPIAMLTHGERTAAYGSSENKNGSSDLSAAGTESAPADMSAYNESHEQSLCRNLLPILQPIFEKTAELSGSEPAGAALPAFHKPHAPPVGLMRHAPPTKVRPVKSRSGGMTLHLAELKTAGSRGDAALANLAKERRVSPREAGTRSELSFGSEYSAFTSVSSPSSQSGSKSGSTNATPRHGRGLTGTASMPALQPYRGHRATEGR